MCCSFLSLLLAFRLGWGVHPGGKSSQIEHSQRENAILAFCLSSLATVPLAAHRATSQNLDPWKLAARNLDSGSGSAACSASTEFAQHPGLRPPSVYVTVIQATNSMVKPATPRILHIRPASRPPRNSWSGRKDALRASLVVAAVVLVATVVCVPVLVTQLAAQRAARMQHGSGVQRPLDASYCQKLPGASQQHCREYADAEGGEKFIAATNWRQMSRATCECHQQFSRFSRFGVSVSQLALTTGGLLMCS